MVLGPFNLSGWRRVALTVSILAVLFSGFFWLGYWTGVGQTLTRQRAPLAAPRSDSPAGEAPVRRPQEVEEAVRL